MSEADQDRSGLADTPRGPPEVGLKVAPGPLSAKLRLEFTYSILSVEPPPTKLSRAKPADKRDDERLRTRLRAGRLSGPGNKVLADCLIQDRSRTGARLRLALDRPLPKSFLLYDDISNIRFFAELAWQKGRDVGVRLRAV